MSDILLNPLTQQPISNESLANLSKLARHQVELEDQIAKTEEKLAQLKVQLEDMSGKIIPDLMDELGMKSFELSDGSSIEIKPFVAAKIPESRTSEAFKWLRDNNYDSIIKREVSSSFGKGEDKKADELVALLRKAGAPFKDMSSVHYQTLKAFCRERIEAGDTAFPKDLFGVFEGKRTKITPAK